MADTKKEYTSNLHPKGDLGTTVYPNVKSENIIDKDATSYTAGKVPDSSLVSKSLDGLNEKIETTKTQVETNKKNIETLQGNYTGLQHQVNTNSSDIALTKTQVDTNKTNIATLQGDVSSLKQDNETTKTTVAGLVSSDTQNKKDIAKNTQNIENLSAVMPTDINVDANGYAILEHDGTEITGQKKKVKFAQTDKNASFNEVTIPTATALKTKDGTSIGGSDFYEITITEFIDEAETGFIITKDDFDEISNNHRNVKLNVFNTYTLYFYYSGEVSGDNGEKQINFTPIKVSVNDPAIESIILFGKVSDNLYYGNLSDIPIINQQVLNNYATKTELNAKQATLYRHTITIGLFTNASDKHLLVMTHKSENNLKIDSIQDLITVFKGTSLSCICTHETTIHISDTVEDIYINNVTHSKINIGNTLAEITLNTASDLEEEPFTDVFGTTGFTITDNVTAMQGGYL